MANGFIDMTGFQIGRWKVIEVDKEETDKHSYYDGKRFRRRTYWKCECQCENKTVKSVLGQNLRNNHSTSCGCWNKERDRTYERKNLQKDMTGEIINCIKVLSKNDNKNNKAIHWNCECLLCGTQFIIDGRNLRKKDAQFSCGCIRSKGEFKIRQILNNANINFVMQYQFNNLVSSKNKALLFDFAIFDNNNNLLALIEYDGEQHFNKNSLYYSEEQIQRDKQKNEYCINNSIKLYRIPYWEYNNLIDLSSLLNEKYLIKGE